MNKQLNEKVIECVTNAHARARELRISTAFKCLQLIIVLLGNFLILFLLKSSGFYTESQSFSFAKFTLSKLEFFRGGALLLKSVADFIFQYILSLCFAYSVTLRGEFYIPTTEYGWASLGDWLLRDRSTRSNWANSLRLDHERWNCLHLTLFSLCWDICFLELGHHAVRKPRRCG